MGCSDLGLSCNNDTIALVISGLDSEQNVASDSTKKVIAKVSKTEFQNETQGVINLSYKNSRIVLLA